MNIAQYKNEFLKSMVYPNEIEKIQVKSEFNNPDFIANALGIQPKKAHPKTEKMLERLTEHLTKEGIIKVSHEA